MRSGAAAHRHSAGAVDASTAADSSSAHSFCEFPYSGAHPSSRACDESYSSGVLKMEWAPLSWSAGPAPCMTCSKYLGPLPGFASLSRATETARSSARRVAKLYGVRLH
jgi:hypothetical protein